MVAFVHRVDRRRRCHCSHHRGARPTWKGIAHALRERGALGTYSPEYHLTVRTIWWIFLLFTFLSISLLWLLSISLLWLAGMPIWDAINHAMTDLATGGFSITDDSIATYDSAVIDFALLPVMLLG